MNEIQLALLCFGIIGGGLILFLIYTLISNLFDDLTPPPFSNSSAVSSLSLQSVSLGPVVQSPTSTSTQVNDADKDLYY